MICIAEEDDQKTDPQKDQQQDKPKNPKAYCTETFGDTIHVATKGGKKGDKSQRKGYGQCWECGEYGHPRRECKVFFERMGKRSTTRRGGLKGNGQHGKGGKWEKREKGKAPKAKIIMGPKGQRAIDLRARLSARA